MTSLYSVCASLKIVSVSVGKPVYLFFVSLSLDLFDFNKLLSTRELAQLNGSVR